MERKQRLIVALSLVLILLAAVQPLSRVEAEQQKEQQKQTDQQQEKKQKNKEKEKQPRVTMTFFNTDLREALKEISLQTGVNIIPDQTVGGVVTAEFEDLPLEKALERVLASGGYTYRKVEDFYLVGLPSPKSNTFSKLSEVKVVKLNHISAKRVFTLLPDFFQPYVHGNTKDNRLTISAPTKKLVRIKKFINKLDQPKPQVKVKVVITEVNSSKMKEIGNKLFSYDESAAGEEKASYDLTDGLLTFEGDYYGKFLSQLKMLEEKQQAKVKANPHVLVTDGEQAELFVGKEENVVIDADDSGDTDSDSRIEEIKVGMKLNLTADVVGKKLIDLQVSPEISHFVEQKRPDIVVQKNSLQTSLRLKSGQTAVLAGMTRQNQSSQREGVPILSKIPLIRWMFGSKTERKGSRELLIMVTPVIQ